MKIDKLIKFILIRCSGTFRCHNSKAFFFSLLIKNSAFHALVYFFFSIYLCAYSFSTFCNFVPLYGLFFLSLHHRPVEYFTADKIMHLYYANLPNNNIFGLFVSTFITFYLLSFTLCVALYFSFFFSNLYLRYKKS